MTTNITSTLNALIKTSKDSEQGFHSAASKVIDQNLKNILLTKTERCKNYVAELQKHVNELNAEAEDSGSVLGAIHRGFLEVKSIIIGNDDYAILVECERGEEAARNNYFQALKEDLPAEILTVIQNQYNQVAKDYLLVCDLREKYAKDNI